MSSSRNLKVIPYLLSIIFLSASLLSDTVSAQEVIPNTVTITKSVSRVSEGAYANRVSDITNTETLEFMIVVQNTTNEPIPSVRVVDTLPRELLYISTDTFPDSVVESADNTSYLWILRALQPDEQRIITYRAKVDIDASDAGRCIINVANLILEQNVVGRSNIQVCVVSSGSSVLGAADAQPGTAVMGSGTIDTALLLSLLGVVFLLASRKLQTTSVRTV